jgi:NAD(P)-dependent dehydrogenase (short-subunit alcohol dehydrogenase family)
MGPDNLDPVLDVHLRGAFNVTQPAWEHMRAQNYGRIVNIMSGAILGLGLHAPYAAGKAGLMGLNADAAIQGRRIGVQVNGVCPVSYSRLAKGGPQDVADRLKQFYPPALVAEAVVYLCSRDNPASGEIFHVGGGRVARYAMFGNAGVYDRELTADLLAEQFDVVRDMAGARLLPLGGNGGPLPDPAEAP